MTKYKKLVRDYIPEIIQSSGKTPTIHIATDKEYDKALSNKLSEEVEEFNESKKTEELADILEVIDAICKFKGINKDSLQKIKKDKARNRGKFNKRVILDSVK